MEKVEAYNLLAAQLARRMNHSELALLADSQAKEIFKIPVTSVPMFDVELAFHWDHKQKGWIEIVGSISHCDNGRRHSMPQVLVVPPP
jgi:hypothetical protein